MAIVRPGRDPRQRGDQPSWATMSTWCARPARCGRLRRWRPGGEAKKATTLSSCCSTRPLLRRERRPGPATAGSCATAATRVVVDDATRCWPMSRPPRPGRRRASVKVGDVRFPPASTPSAAAKDHAQPQRHPPDATALREVLAPRAQKGSLVNAERTALRLRHNAPMTPRRSARSRPWSTPRSAPERRRNAQCS